MKLMELFRGFESQDGAELNRLAVLLKGFPCSPPQMDPQDIVIFPRNDCDKDSGEYKKN